MKNYQTFDQFLNEGKIIYKRGYTDLHPAKSTNEKAAIRNKVLGAIQDGILTEDELNNVIKETGAHGRWVSRNSHYFKMTESGIRLSSYGMKIWERVKNAGAINEGNGFLFALKEAREKGLTEFEYNGKKFPVREKKVNEAASVPSNIMDFAKRKGPAATSLVKKAATWAEKAGKRITGGTAIGKNYSTIILDMKHQGAEIYINLDDETIELFGEEVTDAKSFQQVLHDEANESVVDENIRPDQMEQVAKDLAYSMPNHSKPDEDGKFSAEQVQKAFKYIPDLKHVKDKKDIQTIVDKVLAIVNESENINEAKISPQARFDYFRNLGINPNNQPMTSKYALSILEPGRNFVDFSGELVDGPYYLRYKENQRSIYTFDQVEIETGKVVKEVDVQRGNLALLRRVYGDVKYQVK